MLNIEQKKRILKFIEDRDVDVTELESYKNYGHPDQNFARFAEPDEEDWDLDEEYARKCDEAIEYIEHDGCFEWLDIPDEQKDEVIDFIQEEQVKIVR